MVDRVVANGLEVLPLGAEPADIGVASGKIGAPGSLAAIGAGRTLDASGQIVIPGGSTRMSIVAGRSSCPAPPSIS